jgi:tetratricopeptide (TPR) repeat protein
MPERFIDRPKTKSALLAALLVGMVVAAYGPALTAGFIWDDDVYVTDNPLLSAPDGLERIWLSMDAQSQYFPLTYTAFRIEYGLWGDDPFGYHLINVLLHAANALLLWLLLRRLDIAGAWFAAAVFALHPVHVESVAWVTERKNVMSLFFSLASLLAWLRFTEPRGGSAWRFYAASMIFYVLALSSKATACTLPAAQLLVLWLRGQPIDRRRIAQVAPFFAFGVAMGLVITYWERFHIGTISERFAISPVESLLVATRACWFYLGKLLWPTQLAFSYSKFEIDPSDPLQYGWAIAGALLLWALWRWRSAIGNAPLAAAIFFVATLSPLLGFIPLFTFFYTYVADHYQYVASIGPITLVAAGGTQWLRVHTRLGARVQSSAAALVLVTLGVLVWNQSQIYESEETLWRDAIAKNPQSWMAQTNLGRYLLRNGRVEEAVDAYERVFALKPDAYRAHIAVARALMKLGRDLEAEGHFVAALAERPGHYTSRQALARLLSERGDRAAAMAHYKAMIALVPQNPAGHFLMGRALEADGRRREAMVHYRKALQINPNHAEARRAVGRIRRFREDSSAEPRPER